MFVKNDEGEMVPYSAFMKLEKHQGMNEINRYNLYTTAIIQGAPQTGYSSGQAMAAIQQVAKETLPQGFGIDWQGLSYDEANKGNTATYIFGIVIIFVYLVLVGQYESFLLPLSVLVSLPIGLFGSFLMLKYMGLANDVYCQIGLVMLVGLLGKNAILIVEFAVQRRHEGLSLRDAAIEGGSLRFRPIVMNLVCLHRRPDSVGSSHRSGCHRKPHDWQHGCRRHAHGHVDRSVGDSWSVLPVREDFRRS